MAPARGGNRAGGSKIGAAQNFTFLSDVDDAPTAPAQTDRCTVSLPTSDPGAPLTVQQVLTHIWLMRQILAAVMREGEHYKRIPGDDNKPTLLASGAETLCLLFHLAPTYDVEKRQLASGHREFRVSVTLTAATSRVLIGQGVGAGTTLENEFRRRRACAAEVTDHDAPLPYGEICQKSLGGDEVVMDDPAEHYDTVLKVAKKRALVDAILTTTAASDLFSQDLDDIGASRAALTPTANGSGTGRDFRFTPIHFGKNRGLILAELTPQQIHWYEEEWMPRKQAEGPRGDDNRALIAGLKAYRQWRNAEKQAQAAANPRPKRARRSAKERSAQPV